MQTSTIGTVNVFLRAVSLPEFYTESSHSSNEQNIQALTETDQTLQTQAVLQTTKKRLDFIQRRYIPF